MNVLHIDLGRGWRGGQQQAFLLHRELVRQGHRSLLLVPRGSALEARARAERLPVVPVPSCRPWHPGTVVRAMLAGRGCEIVHAHDSHAVALAVLVRRWLPGARVVCHRRVSYGFGGSPGSRWKYRGVDGWVAVSAEVAETVRAAGFGDRPLRVVHSALDVEAFRREAEQADLRALRDSLEIPPGAPVVGSVGAFTPQKGHGVLLEAAGPLREAVPDVHFVFVGEGPLQRAVEQRARALGVWPACRFTGFRRDVGPLTRLLTVAAVPSVDGEGSSAAIKEAMALGVPVVVSDLAGNVEVLGDAGLVVPRRHPEALEGAILRLLRDADLRVELGARGRQRVERFGPRAMSGGVLDLYRELLP